MTAHVRTLVWPGRPCCRVSDSSGEGFAARLFKAGHPEGWVRAFSDSPGAFTGEFNKVGGLRGWAERGGVA